MREGHAVQYNAILSPAAISDTIRAVKFKGATRLSVVFLREGYNGRTFKMG